MDTVDRIKAIIDTHKMSIRGFAIKCGIAQQTLDGQLKRKRAVSVDTITAIAVAFPEISANWILLGEGPMLKTDKESARVEKLINTITTLQDNIDLKSETIDALRERICQLETQLSKLTAL